MSPNHQSADVLYVSDMARKYGKTEAAIRMAVTRGADWIPKPFKMGSRIAWRAEDVDRFLKEQSESTSGRRVRGGRS